MVEIAMKMMFCLLLASLIGGVIGFLIGRMFKCEKDESEKNGFSERTSSTDDVFEVDEVEDVEPLKQALLESKTQTTEDVETKSLTQEEETAIALMDIVKKESGFDVEEGVKPKLLDAPRDGKADDLKEISGVGLKLEKVLNELGVYHFDQIASWSEEELKWIDSHLSSFKGRAKRENWIEQAKVLASGGVTEFSQRVKKGEIDRY